MYPRLVNANFNLNVRRKQLLDEDLNDLGLDERGKSALRTFRERLHLLERAMRQEPWPVWRMYPGLLEVNINA